VESFTEKPDASTAAKYIGEGYLWNGGIFAWKTRTFLDELAKYAPELDVIPECLNRGTSLEYFNAVPSISIDYAVMEKSKRVAVIPCDVGWSDVGTWKGLYELSKKGGVIVASETLAVMREQLGLGLPMFVGKPWGHEEIWARTPDYVGKILVIKKNHRLSYQYHRVKEETIRLLEGVMDLECDAGGMHKIVRLSAGDVFHIPPQTKHRMIAVEDCQVLETSTPHLNDVVRVEDDYGRS